MTLSEKIKQAISKELSGFLISDKHIPESIEIKVINTGSIARLTFNAEKIAEILENNQ